MAKKTVRTVDELKELIGYAEHTIKYHSEEMARMAMRVTPNAEKGNLKNVEDLCKRIVSEGKAVTKAKKDLRELKAELKEAEAQEINSSNDKIDLFLAKWKEQAREYFTNLRAEYLEVKGNKEEFKKFKEYHSQKELDIVSQMYNEDFLENVLKMEVVNKKKTFIQKVEGYAGKIIDTKGLRIGVDGLINGIVIGEQDTVRVETIYAGGHSIQCLHYRVLVKSLNN